MNRLNVARFVFNQFSDPLVIDDTVCEFGLFGGFELDKDGESSTLGGESSSSQSSKLLDEIFRIITGIDANDEEWKRTEVSHLSLFRDMYHDASPKEKEKLRSIATLSPFGCDGRFYVSYLDKDKFISSTESDIEVRELHEILLDKTLFLAVRKLMD